MTSRRSSGPGGPHQLQLVVDRLAETSQGRPLEETVQRLESAMKAAGLEPPSESWLDAVARAAVHGHHYVVSGTDQLESTGLPVGSPLDHAPATLHVTAAPPVDPLGSAPAAADTAPTPRPDAVAAPSSGPAPRLTPHERGRAAIYALALGLGVALALWVRRRRAAGTTGSASATTRTDRLGAETAHRLRLPRARP